MQFLIHGCLLVWGLNILLFMVLIIKVVFDKNTGYNFNLTKEDLEFLIDLQQEMLTQDHVSQAAPRFWVVAGSQKVPTAPEYSDGEQLIHDVDIVADEIEGAIEYFKEKIYDEIDDDAGYTIIIEKENTPFDSWRVAKIDKECTPEIVADYTDGDEIISETCCITSITELIDALVDAEFIQEDEYRAGCYRNEHYRYPNTMFLTNRSCKEHIKANYYHYSGDAHSYAMTAWRSPEVSRLWDILDKIDWHRMKEDAYGTGDATATEECTGSSEQG